MTGNTSLFLESLSEAFKQVQQEDLLQEIRAKGWEHFLKKGLPSKKGSSFQYAPLHKLYKTSFSLILEEKNPLPSFSKKEGSTLIFINGKFQKELSCLEDEAKQIIALPLKEAMQSYGSFLRKQFLSSFEGERNSFVLLNQALGQEGTFLYIPPKLVLTKPLNVLHILDLPSQFMIHPRIQIFIGKGAKIQVSAKSLSRQEKSFFHNQVIDLFLEEEASYTQVEESDFSDSSWSFQGVRAHLKKKSSLDLFSFTKGSTTTYQDIHVKLLGEESHAVLRGISLLDGKRESHLSILAEHLAPNTSSDQYYKSVLSDQSSLSFEGGIKIAKEAQKTEAYQLNQNLLLSDQVSAMSRPNLEIFADDVKASHGATTAQLKEEELFYLQTRGLSKKEAKNHLIYGFCKELLEKVSLSCFRQEITQKVQKYLGR